MTSVYSSNEKEVDYMERFKRFIKILLTLPGIILSTATVFYFILIYQSFSHCHWDNAISLIYLNKEQLITYGIGLIAASVVFFQIISIQEQFRLQTLIEYSKQ
jgi:ABC-type dipeptide/oligopeptide/nickel transport system permease subunit